MNLVEGMLISQDECDAVLEHMEDRLLVTLAKPILNPDIVVEACNALSILLNEREHLPILMELGISERLAREYLKDAKWMLSRDYLTNKLHRELGPDYGKTLQLQPSHCKNVTERIMPLGVLFHIAAGNIDGLPVFTVIEGLLSGNINILKLPAEEGGISVRLLQELFNLEPRLAEYVYVFDYSSNDIEVMKRLASLSDAIVLWGGDAAIKSVREMATPNTKIIEWGHKMSFAYISGEEVSDRALEGIAVNICHTNQLLCSSCQGVFLDTASMEKVYQFCERFLPILESVSASEPSELGIGIEAQVGLRVYNEQLKAVFNDAKVFRAKNCSLTAYTDNQLTTSMMFRNPWVRRLPRSLILETLRPYKGYLQTVGLICGDGDAKKLSEIFCKSGAVRVTDGLHMSQTYDGMAHDGEYPLRRYTKTVSLEI